MCCKNHTVYWRLWFSCEDWHMVCWTYTSVSKEPQKHWCTCTWPHGVTFEKTGMFHLRHMRMPHEIAVTSIIGFVSRCNSWLLQPPWQDATIWRARRCSTMSPLFRQRHRMWVAYWPCLQGAKLVLVIYCLNCSGMCMYIHNSHCLVMGAL
jgi:hypothetical protein